MGSSNFLSFCGHSFVQYATPSQTTAPRPAHSTACRPYLSSSCRYVSAIYAASARGAGPGRKRQTDLLRALVAVRHELAQPDRALEPLLGLVQVRRPANRNTDNGLEHASEKKQRSARESKAGPQSRSIRPQSMRERAERGEQEKGTTARMTLQARVVRRRQQPLPLVRRVPVLALISAQSRDREAS